MSIFTIHRGLIDLITSITPSTEPTHTFTHAEDQSGNYVALEDIPDQTIRDFDLQVEDSTQDDVLAGYPPHRFRVTFMLRVRYPVANKMYYSLLAQEDSQLISNTLIHPSNFPEGVCTIIPPTDPELSTVDNPNGAPFYLLLEIPVEVIYWA